ncbi:metal ABC transporter ATP-binding protein [Patescibacteria group bacterium]|nr:metal ABC transporter ATP-binding protein [Patescibacteria group bacterium]
MSTSVVSVKNLFVHYGENEVLHDISFEINKGTIAAIIGPNGSGKSTLFKAILGLIPYSGQIKVLKKPIKQSLKQVSYIPQYFDFDRTLPITVKEFLNLTNLTNKKVDNSVCREVHVDFLLNKKIGELSGGQLQRVLFANALMNKPEILFLDEAAAGIDVEGAKTLYELIEHVNKKHSVTIIMISHEINMVYKFADQIICLNRDLVCDGTPKQALTDEIMKKLYGENMSVKSHKHI